MKKASLALQLFNDAKADISRTRNTINKYAKMLKEHQKQMLHIVKMVCPEPIGDRWSDDFCKYVRVDATMSKPVILFYLDNIDGFKDERLEAVLWYLGSLDGEREPKSSEYAELLNRTYRFDFGGFDVRVDATVKSDSPTCRKVVVSSELVKQDKYAIQCD